jgi:hypothetical protein
MAVTDYWHSHRPAEQTADEPTNDDPKEVSDDSPHD